MLLVKEIDKRATKKNAVSVLENYRFLSRIAGEAYTPKVTQSYSLEPKGSHSGHSSNVEREVLNRVEAWYELEAISSAINRVIDPFIRQILIEKYCAWNNKTDIAIYVELGYSETEFYRMLERGILEFAECYRSGKTLIFRKHK